ncbi:MAG: hypothetical protein ACU841_03995 [Gammaproteobacteria bacterium]
MTYSIAHFHRRIMVAASHALPHSIDSFGQQIRLPQMIARIKASSQQQHAISRIRPGHMTQRIGRKDSGLDALAEIL